MTDYCLILNLNQNIMNRDFDKYSFKATQKKNTLESYRVGQPMVREEFSVYHIRFTTDFY